MNAKIFHRVFLAVALALFAIPLSSCAYVTDMGYYFHIVSGQIHILSGRIPIRDMLAKEKTPPDVKTNLRKVLEMREFAIHELGLPETDSFLTYADIGRKYANWSLTVAPEFSFTPKVWCFPIKGCVTHLTFWSQEKALEYALPFRLKGYDVVVRGVIAYSTETWFSDPVLNIYFEWPDYVLAGTIFHEWAHEKLSIKNDSAFNESFANFVEQTGEIIWATKKHGTEYAQKILEGRKKTSELEKILSQTQKELRELYAEKMPAEKMRILKAEIFLRIKSRYEELKKTWGGFNGYDVYMNKKWNNARLAHESEYSDFVPVFQRLYDECGQKLDCFYKKAERLGNMKPALRKREMRRLLDDEV